MASSMGAMPLNERERSICDAISRDRLMEVTERLATWVRLSGSPAELEAAAYVRGLLDEAGLETAFGPHDAYISLPGPARLETEDGATLPCITHSFAAPTGPGGLEGEVVDCGDDPGAARGRIALLGGLAGPAPVRRAEAEGAAAQVYVNGRITHEMIVSPVWGSPGPDDLVRLPRTPVVSITDETAAEIRRRLARGERRLRIFAEVDTGWRQTPLLIARLAGASDDFVLLSGHLDSWHRGAMDNGSANAAMVEVARALAGHRSQLRRSLVVAFWSGHSHGRYSGSAWFADHRWEALTRRCVAHVNVDSLGGLGATALAGGIATASLRELGAEAIAAIAGVEFRGSRVGRAGDQSFLGHGVPSLWMSLSEQPSGGLGWWWHTTEDTPDKIDPDLLLRDARIYAAAVARLVTADALPLSAAAEAAEVAALLDDLARASAGRFDLTPATGRAGELAELCARLDQADPDAYNVAVTGVLRALLPISYTTGGSFAPDPALLVPPLPSLAPVRRLAELDPESDEARFLTVALVRARNRVVAALDAALEAAQRGLRRNS